MQVFSSSCTVPSVLTMHRYRMYFKICVILCALPVFTSQLASDGLKEGAEKTANSQAASLARTEKKTNQPNLHTVETEEEFNQLISSAGESQLVVLYFGTRWLDDCITLLEKIKTMAGSHPKVMFIHVDVWKKPLDNVVNRYVESKIVDLPRVKILKNNEQVFNIIGYKNPGASDKIEKQIKELGSEEKNSNEALLPSPPP